EIHTSCANWLLLRLPEAGPDSIEVVQRCRALGVALRCCADFPSLGTHWIRVSVRNEFGNSKIAEALTQVLRREGTSRLPQTRFDSAAIVDPGDLCDVNRSATNTPPQFRASTRLSDSCDVNRSATNTPPQRRAIMLQGCSSDAGKSMLVTALCRCLVQDGYRVAPFKAQNMSNNSGVARDGGEIGRAQVLQAQASGVEPDTRMNPILLKPNSDRGAQVVIRGRSIGHRDALEYHATKRRCLDEALRAFDDLASEYDVIVCEGAGSAGEMNLRSADIVNMGFVTQRPMPVLLVGDIDRGGVYASFIGHMEVMSEADRAYVRGFVVNRFRGVKSLLGDAHSAVERHTGCPVLGVVPYLADLGLPDEDRLSLTSGARRWGDPAAPLRIAAVAGPHVSNFTDLDALTCEDDVWVRLVERAEELEQPDLIVLLGTKNTLADLAHFRRIGLAHAILDAQRKGATIIGICGGLQMLGQRIDDDEGVESGHRSAEGLSLLPLATRFAVEKTVRRTTGKHVASQMPVTGYEIHHGESELSSLSPWLVDDAGAALGVALPEQRVFGTYLHGLFDADGFRRHFLDDIRERKGMERLGRSRRSSDLEPSIDRLAQVFRESVDLPAIYRMIGLRA
ncbi:MAG TPA: cobyric acid synthase, partial [Polyangiaceae bacterium]|nr:cobyric acid synthase [Polyangiaceae bacterium]